MTILTIEVVANLATSSILLAGFSGLLSRRSWSRKTSIYALLIQILEIICCRTLIYAAILEETHGFPFFNFHLLPYVGLVTANIAVVQYLRSDSVKNYLSLKREAIQLEINL